LMHLLAQGYRHSNHGLLSLLKPRKRDGLEQMRLSMMGGAERAKRCTR
jgi:hypothetical protein